MVICSTVTCGICLFRWILDVGRADVGMNHMRFRKNNQIWREETTKFLQILWLPSTKIDGKIKVGCFFGVCIYLMKAIKILLLSQLLQISSQLRRKP
jgi:hypothetical protein